jgi:hypothetical protein
MLAFVTVIQAHVSVPLVQLGNFANTAMMRHAVATVVYLLMGRAFVSLSTRESIVKSISPRRMHAKQTHASQDRACRRQCLPFSHAAAAVGLKVPLAIDASKESTALSVIGTVQTVMLAFVTVIPAHASVPLVQLGNIANTATM